MDRKYNGKLLNVAKNLRKNMTKQECRLWFDFLRDYPVRFYRQKIIGNYIVDFYCAKAKLVIELDGSQHFEDKVIYDEKRTEYLEQYGLTVLRIPNNYANEHFEEMCEYIDSVVSSALANS